MNRTRATALCLVNWKGVFYERYQLDRHVTVLEGANGAGKTTVMIAAYVVLLPDLSRLRFTNLGETAATGGDRGIHGRLGEPGRPSYAVMELALPSDERLLAGVKLVRGAQPSLDATPFVISGLAPDVRLQDLFLVREGELDMVPELDEVKRAVKERGATLESFRSVKDYLAVLFERGVTPLRLSSEEDRTKLNEMLRTSMTGGISKALTTELRSFLLKEETGLGETLGRMRANLEACRRTRIEVAESRLLEREISGIYEAGQAMFSAALLSAREAAEEGKTRIEAGQRALSEAESRLRELTQAAEDSVARQETLDARLTEAQADVARLTAQRDRRRAEDVARERLQELTREVEQKTALAEQTRRAQAAASEERSARKEARERAAEAYDKASHGLAHLQAGLEELHRRAHAHRLLNTRLAEAAALYGKPVSLDDAAAVVSELTDALARLDAERTRLERDVRDAGARARDHARALSALRTLEAISPAEVESGRHARARAVLARLGALGERVARLDVLTRELAEAERLAKRQRDARGRAAALGFTAFLDEAGASARIDEKLEALERTAREASDSARREEDAVQAVRLRRDALAAERKALGERVARHASAAARVARLRDLVSTPLTSRADVLLARDQLGDRQRLLAARKVALSEERESLLRRAATVSTSGELDPTLLRLRDELGAELLASRYDDVAPESATWLEAQLGPLARALVVDDMDAALDALGKVDHDLSTVWLVRADAAVARLPEGESEGRADDARDVVVNESFGVRVTRPVTTPMLGRRAREKQAETLRSAAAALDAELESVGEQHRALTGARRELDALLDEVDALGQGDPAPELLRIESELDGLGELDARHRGLVTEARAKEVECASQLPALRRLLGDAGLLEPPDHTARHQTLAREHAEALAVRDRLEGVAEARRVLAECVDELRNEPPSAEELTERAAERDRLTAERDRLAQTQVALSDALAHRYAESWSDAETAIGASASLAPALEAQHAAAREAVQLGEVQIAEAEARWEEATAAHQASEAARVAAVAHQARALSELSELGGAESDLPHDALSSALDEALARQKELDAEARKRVEETTLLKERARRAHEAEGYARAELAAATGGVAPAAQRWQELATAAREAHLLDEVLSAQDARGASQRGAGALAAEAQSKRELLIDRLASARGGGTLADQLRGESAHVRIWLEVRDWLRRRVPAQVADTGEPLEALERLRDHLDVLESRLARQELDLRGASEDVARGIEVQVRRAKGQVRRLNQHLDSVSFGSVSGVRVEMRRVERMEQILRALRDGETQELLFLASMPIEEALDEIFRRHGGGRGGGLRLLDYREYLDLVVEVRRRGGTTWEVTSPTKLSTGEAIGVGAALMMVVLTEWERDSHLLHGRRMGGSLRFLFLDEANRLSRDNLAILFDLCRNLDLQLLVAAPEVARAEGNTTYRLIRRVGDDGREEVIVSGRRALPASDEPALDADVPDAEPQPLTEPSA